jgi:excisionase family DNA binding protein
MDQRLLTVDEVAELCRTSPATVRYWRHMGSGPKSFRLGRRVLFREDDVRSWIEAEMHAQLGA